MWMGAGVDGCGCGWVSVWIGAGVDGCGVDGCGCGWVSVWMGAGVDGCNCMFKFNVILILTLQCSAVRCSAHQGDIV